MSKFKEELNQVDYSYRSLMKAKWVLSLCLLFAFTVLGSFSYKKKLDSIIYSALSSSSACPITIKDYHFEFFSPKIVINNLSINKRCLGSARSDIRLDQVFVKFRGLSLSPFGPSFKIETKIFNNPIETFLIPGFTSVSVLMENESEDGKFNSPENKLNISDLNKIIPALKLAGELVISTFYLKMGYNGKIQDLTANITSKNLFVPEQKISGFRFNKMELNELLLQLNYLKNNKVRVKEFVLGDEQSPIIAKFTGDMNLNLRQFKNSHINLRGELSLSEQMLKDYGILKLYLGRFDKKDKFYQIQIKGKLSGPPALSTAR